MPKTERNWVWVASTETVRAGKVSVLACVETAVMVAVYWAVAWIFDTHLHLLVGVLVMPLMLFRSDESVALGLKWGQNLVDRTVDDDKQIIHSANLLIAGLSLIGFPAYYIQICVGFVCVAALTMLIDDTLSQKVRYRPKPGFENVFLTVLTGPSFVTGLVCFMFLAPILIRVVSCFATIRTGVGQVTLNWRRIVFLNDAGVVPEPLPGAEGNLKIWSISFHFKIFKEMISNSNSQGKRFRFPYLVLAPFVVFPTFLSSIFFRWALKSTAWFYLPLLFLTSSYDGKNRLIWMRSFPRTVLTWVRLILSVVGIGVAATALIIDLPSALSALQFGRDMELPIVPLSLILVLDWGNLHPWQFASLPTAILTVILFFRLDYLGRAEQAGAVIAENGLALRTMVWADRLRSVCALAWLALITSPTLRFFHCAGQLPDWAARPLAWFFGPGACGGLAF